jgi:tetraacyldisaccharide 4'-kinase
MSGRLERDWYRPSLTFQTKCLLPFSWLFRAVVAARRFLYRHKIKKTYRFSAPVIVIGNITVGGTGKTPFIIALAQWLHSEGYKPGIVSRGVGGEKQLMPYWVNETSNVREVGDEAVLLAKRTQCPLVICIDRVAAVKELLANTACNIVLSDDGLQHYRMHRDIEIALIDVLRGLGNQQLLPAGPLREPVSRLNEVDFVIDGVVLDGDGLVSVKNETQKIPLHLFEHKHVHAVAAIGNPNKFFNLLREKGLEVIEHVFPDHYHFKKNDFDFDDAFPIIMTEKDAVKCHEFAEENFWYLPVAVKLDEQFIKNFRSRL